MTCYANESGLLAPTVKNTFLEFKCDSEPDRPRRKSVPASSRLCQQDVSDGKLIITNMEESDASTDMQTDGSTCSESGVKTPTNLDDCYLCESFDPMGWSEQMSPEISWCQPSTHLSQVEDVRQPLSSKASAFKPQVAPEEPPQEYHRGFADVITWVKNVLYDSAHVANVEISEDAGGWSIVIQPRPLQDSEAAWQLETLLALAKQVLLDAASKSRSIFLLGFCSPKPFTMQPQGFQATLAAMESPVNACWHVFKKGFCRHGDSCSKSHPVNEVPVRVLVEAVQFNSCTRFVSAFKQEVADLTMAVMSTMEQCPCADKVEAFKDRDRQGWTIEVTAKPGMTVQRNYLLSLAKNALYSGTNTSNTAYIMGYADKPFMAKSKGFVAMLGDMQDQSVACWDFYSKGVCRHGCACRWAHPECLMPINVMLNEGLPSLSD